MINEKIFEAVESANAEALEKALMEERRERRQQEFSKTIENFSKMKVKNGGE